MSATGLKAFDTTIQKTNVWLDDVMRELDLPDRHRAYTALRATLHALRDRLGVEEVAQLAAQLPMLVRGFYYEGWDPTGKPLKAHTAAQFFSCILEGFRGDDPVDPEQVARAVFAVLSRRMSKGEIEDVQRALPEEIRSLWP